MGRRSISSTKTGKFMNPTDQARKEARRKELKKNKKQRQLVRQAVLKSKDPTHIITEIEALDRMEFDPNNPPPYNVKVIQDKRKKLKETWQKLFKFYEREDPKFGSELRHLEVEYEKKKSQIMSIYESVKQAEKVNLDDIPLPDAPSNQAALALYHANEIPLPAQPVISSSTQKGILKKSDTSGKRKPPGPPPGTPPPLTEFECDDDEKELGITADDNLKNVLSKTKKIRFADDTAKAVVPTPPVTTKPQHYPAPPIPAYTTPQLRPPIPPPQPGYPLAKPTVNAYGSVIPPPTVPRMPLSGATTITSLSSAAQKYPQSSQNVLMAGPTRSTAASTSLSDDRGASIGATTIEAKPMLRNKMAEITRFVPTSLLIKNDQKRKMQSSDNQYSYLQQQQYSQSSSMQQNQPQKASTDEAYEQFMKEMEKLL